MLEHILPELEQRLQSSTCSHTTQQRLQLIAEELMTNTIKYGYPDQPRGSFTLAINIHQTNAEIIYTDDGIPFDPTHPPEVDTGLSVADRPIGGLGLHLIAQLCPDSHYCRTQGQNQLRLVLAMTDTINTAPP